MRTLLLVALVACADTRAPESIDGWYGPAGPLDEDVTESVAFTDEPYSFDQNGIAELYDLNMFSGFGASLSRRYAPADAPPSNACGWTTSPDLPREFWATVTLHPRYYYKTEGCQSNDFLSEVYDSEEKYYGNYFIEDGERGLFVLQDSKVAHFDIGDRVKIRVRAVGSRFELDTVVAHDIIEVERGPFPIHYTPAGPTTCAVGTPDPGWPRINLDTFDPTDHVDLAVFAHNSITCEYNDPTLRGRVVRASGIVLQEPDTFGQFFVLNDDDPLNKQIYQVALDSELNRRKWSFPVGSRIQATGPVMNAFGNSIVVMKVGQVEVLEAP